MTQSVHRYTYDIFDTDTTTYTPARAQVEMLLAIDQTEKLVAELDNWFKPHLASETDPIFIAWRKGRCYKASCDNLKEDLTVGYTKEVQVTGLQGQLNLFLKTAKAYLSENQYTQQTNSSAFKLIEYLNNDFYTTLDTVVQRYNEYSAESTVVATAVLFSLATCVFISFDIYYQIGFSQASKKFTNGNKQLICFVFSVNTADRMKNADLNTFVESAGASIN